MNNVVFYTEVNNQRQHHFYVRIKQDVDSAPELRDNCCHGFCIQTKAWSKLSHSFDCQCPKSTITDYLSSANHWIQFLIIYKHV